MPLSDADPAPDGDIWFRIITQERYIKKNGRIHHSAFGGKAISRPAPEKRRPWSRELSGRLRSYAGYLEDIRCEAIAFCERISTAGGKKTFSGIIYARVADAKLAWETITTGVHFTPLDNDKAHADLTFNGWPANESKEEKERFLLWLTEKLKGLTSAQLSLLPEAQ
jgi:hypothetical protein